MLPMACGNIYVVLLSLYILTSSVKFPTPPEYFSKYLKLCKIQYFCNKELNWYFVFTKPRANMCEIIFTEVFSHSNSFMCLVGTITHVCLRAIWSLLLVEIFFAMCWRPIGGLVPCATLWSVSIFFTHTPFQFEV